MVVTPTRNACASAGRENVPESSTHSVDFSTGSEQVSKRIPSFLTQVIFRAARPVKVPHFAHAVRW